MKRIICIITGLVLGLGVVTALSAGSVRTFEEMDVNSDGYLSIGEAVLETSITTNWPRVDTDENGLIDISEFSAFESVDRYAPPYEREAPEPGAAPF